MPDTAAKHLSPAVRSALLLGGNAAHLSLDRKNLRRLGLRVEELFNSGRKAALHMLDHDIDVVVCDQGLTDMSIPDFIRLIKLHPRLAAVPVLVVSTDNTREGVLGAKKAGCGSYLIRPYSQAAFTRQLSILLAPGRPENTPAAASEQAFFEALKGSEPCTPPADPAETAFEEGRRLLKLHRYAEAAQSFKAALKLRPELAEAAHGLAKAWKGLGHPAAYKETLLEASRLYLRQDRLSEAYALTAELRKLDPLVKDPVQHEISTLIRTKHFSRAAQLLAKTWNNQPIPKSVYDQLARDCHFTDNPLEAAETLSQELSKTQRFLEPERITHRIMGPAQETQEVRRESPRSGVFGSLRDVIAVAKYTFQAYRKGDALGRA